MAELNHSYLPDLNNNLPFPQVSVLICTRNRPQLLTRLVDSILQGDQVPAEIVIIDDSDTPHLALRQLADASESASGDCHIHYIWEHSRGLSRANNQAVAAASYEFLVFTQDDVTVSPTWLKEIVRALLAAGERAVVTGQVKPGDMGIKRGWAPSTFTEIQPLVFQGRISKDVLFAQNMALYRSAVYAIGGFDPRLGPGTAYPSAEDNDFGFRLLEAGYRIVYAPQAVTYHLTWRSGKEYLPLNWNYGLGQGAFYARHLSLSDRYILGRFARDLKYYGLSPLRTIWRQPMRAAGQAMMTAGLLVGALRWWWTYRKGQV